MTKTGVVPGLSPGKAGNMPSIRWLAHGRRPHGVTLIALVQAVNAVTLGFFLGLAEFVDEIEVKLPEYYSPIGAAFLIVGLVTALGLFFLQRWAWVATMLWAGLVLLLGLYARVTGETVSYFTLVVTIIQVFYLNLTEVQEAFEKKTHYEFVAPGVEHG